MNTSLLARISFTTLALLLAFAPVFASASACPNLYRNLSFGSRGQDVIALQTFLIAEGDLAAGNNTGYFGRMTEAAVKSWQAKNGVVSSGTAATTGYGAVGPRTRAKIASVCGGGGGTVSANFSATPTSGAAPFGVSFSGSVPITLFGYYLQYGDGTTNSIECNPGSNSRCTFNFSHIYTNVGTYTVKLTEAAKPPVATLATVTITVTGATSNLSCTSDSQCPSSNYKCEAISGYGTSCAYTSSGQPVDPNCSSTSVITQGVCKLKEGRSCSTSADCTSGMLCHAGVCTNPIGKVCNGASEASEETKCGAGWRCVQDCGAPVSYQGEPAPGYHCMLNEQASKPRMCPQCLAGSSMIDTPAGNVRVKDLQKGMSVWTTDSDLHRISGIVEVTSKVSVSNHTVIRLTLSDGRNIFVSPGHPTVDGRTVGTLTVGDTYDGATVASAERVPYTEDATYDLLPSGDTGFYWADGILLGSTLKK